MTAPIHGSISHWLCVSTLLLQFGMASAQVGPAYQVADINGGTVASQFNPRFYAELDGWLYFSAHTSSTGQELFRTDGTAEGTELVADICAGACSSQGLYSYAASAVFAGELYFAACADQRGDCGLWKTDGTEVAPVFEALVSELMPYKDVLLVFTVFNEVLRTNGRDPGTVLFELGTGLVSTVQAEDGVYIWAATTLMTPQVSEVWHTDGTEAGSRLIHSDAALRFNPFLFDGRAVFSIADQLWLGDPSGVEPLLADSTFNYPIVVGAADGVLFIRSSFRELWRTDGTAAGTAFLAEAIPRNGMDSTGGFLRILSRAHEGELYFAHHQYANPILFRTTGGAGTTAIHEFPDAVERLEVVDGSLYVVTGSRRQTLWRVDANSATPNRVVTLGDRELFGDLVSYQDTVVFDRLSTNGIGLESQLAVVDGDDGEVVVLGGRESGASSNPRELRRDRHQVLFRAGSSNERWLSDGSPDGTFQAVGLTSFNSIVQVGDEALISSSGLRRVNEDGSLTLVFERPAGEGFVPDAVVIDRGVLLVTESADRTGRFYLGDRDSGSLEFLADSFHGFTASGRDKVQSAPLGDGALLILNEEMIWFTNGTPGGTWQVFDMTALCDCSVKEPVRVGQFVYFAKSMGEEAPSLWRSDGTPKGTEMVRELPRHDGGRNEYPPVLRDLTPVGNQLFFVLDEPSHGAELWASDGSPEGTVLLRDIRPGAESSTPHDLTALKVATGIGKAARQRLFFSADDGVQGRELWTSDGSAEGTAAVLDLWPGRRGSDPRDLTAAFGRLIFAAADSVHGTELWVSDGSASGTRLLQDLQPGPLPGDPHSFTVTDELVFFNARTEATGAELWAMPATALFEVLFEVRLPPLSLSSPRRVP